MNIFINGHAVSNQYYDACCDNLSNGLNADELHDFVNAFDGCAFE